MTALKVKREFFIRQLSSTALFILQISRSLIKIPPDGSVNEVRQKIRATRSDDRVYNVFYNHVNEQYVHLQGLIAELCRVNVSLMYLSDIVKHKDGVPPEPLHSLWNYMLRHFFETPSMLIDANDMNGGDIATMKNWLIEFADVVIELKFNAPTLTSSLVEPLTTQSQTQDSDEDDSHNNGNDTVRILI
jgi:hypothetical protein